MARSVTSIVCFLFCMCFIHSFFNFVHPAVAGDCNQDCIEALQKRADEFWGHRVKGKFEKAYEYEDPATVKDVNLTKYVQSIGGGVRWLSAKAEQVTLKEGDIASVLIRIRYQWTFTNDVPKEGFEGTFYDPWKQIDGTWYHIYKKPGYHKQKLGEKKETTTGQSESEPAENAANQKPEAESNK